MILDWKLVISKLYYLLHIKITVIPTHCQIWVFFSPTVAFNTKCGVFLILASFFNSLHINWVSIIQFTSDTSYLELAESPRLMALSHKTTLTLDGEIKYNPLILLTIWLKIRSFLGVLLEGLLQKLTKSIKNFITVTRGFLCCFIFFLILLTKWIRS